MVFRKKSLAQQPPWESRLVQELQQQIVNGKINRTFVVILSPVVQIPVELEKQIVVIEHEGCNRQPAGNVG